MLESKCFVLFRRYAKYRFLDFFSAPGYQVLTVAPVVTTDLKKLIDYHSSFAPDLLNNLTWLVNALPVDQAPC